MCNSEFAFNFDNNNNNIIIHINNIQHCDYDKTRIYKSQHCTIIIFSDGRIISRIYTYSKTKTLKNVLIHFVYNVRCNAYIMLQYLSRLCTGWWEIHVKNTIDCGCRCMSISTEVPILRPFWSSVKNQDNFIWPRQISSVGKYTQISERNSIWKILIRV